MCIAATNQLLLVTVVTFVTSVSDSSPGPPLLSLLIS